jgi:hypothetical protein
MPSWKKVIISGSNAALNSLTVTNGITGSLFGTASFATTASFLNNTTNAFIQNGNSFGTTALLGTNDNQSLALETSGSTRMFISSSGNVGIGTTTPGVRFVNSGATASSGPTLGSGIVGSQALLSANGVYGLYSGVSSNGDVWHQVQRNDSITAVYNLLLQPSGGNVSIGKATANAKLDVSGSAIVSGSFTVIPETVREFQVRTTGVDIGNLITDAHTVTGSLSVSGSLNVGISTITAARIASSTAGAVLASTGSGAAPEYKTISLTNGTVTSGSGTLTLAIQNAAADGSTKGIAAFNSTDFDASSGVISIDTVDGGTY